MLHLARPRDPGLPRPGPGRPPALPRDPQLGRRVPARPALAGRRRARLRPARPLGDGGGPRPAPRGALRRRRRRLRLLARRGAGAGSRLRRAPSRRSGSPPRPAATSARSPSTPATRLLERAAARPARPDPDDARRGAVRPVPARRAADDRRPAPQPAAADGERRPGPPRRGPRPRALGRREPDAARRLRVPAGLRRPHRPARSCARATSRGSTTPPCGPAGRPGRSPGFARAARDLEDPELLAAAVRAAEWWLAHTTSGALPRFDFSAVPDAPRDSSAQAIAGAGLRILADRCAATGTCDAARYAAAADVARATLARPAGARPAARPPRRGRLQHRRPALGRERRAAVGQRLPRRAPARGMSRLRRRALLALATSGAFERAVRAVPGGEERAWRSARRYVAADPMATARRLHAAGLSASVDLFGEHGTAANAPSVAARYRALCAEAAAVPGAWLSLDLSHLAFDPGLLRRGRRGGPARAPAADRGRGGRRDRPGPRRGAGRARRRAAGRGDAAGQPAPLPRRRRPARRRGRARPPRQGRLRGARRAALGTGHRRRLRRPRPPAARRRGRARARHPRRPAARPAARRPALRPLRAPARRPARTTRPRSPPRAATSASTCRSASSGSATSCGAAPRRRAPENDERPADAGRSQDGFERCGGAS